MTIQKKIFFSFLLATVLVCGITVLDYTGVFNLIETRFHDPVLSEAVIRQTANDAQILNDILSDMKNRFNAALLVPSVYRSFRPGRNDADLYAISGLFGTMTETVPGLYSVCLVDTAENTIIFSTNPADSVGDTVYVTIQEQFQLVMDKSNNTTIFTFSVNDESGIQRGIALFSVSAGSLAESFAARKKAGYGKKIALIDEPAGFVYDYPTSDSTDEIFYRISGIWNERYRSITPLASADEAIMLVSVRMGMGFYFGRIINENTLVFPQSVKIFILITIFITVFLIIFFLLSLMQFSSMIVPDDPGREIAYIEDLEIAEDPGEGYGRGLLAAALPLADEPVVLEDIGTIEAASPFTSMFSSAIPLNDPQLLHEADDQTSAAEVIFEENGIPYIDSHVVSKNSEKKINDNFIKLVDSVINKEKNDFYS